MPFEQHLSPTYNSQVLAQASPATEVAGMQISLEAYRGRFPDRPEPAPLEYAGQWVAWNKNRTKIISHGPRFREVRAQAIAAGCDAPLMQKVLSTPFVGQS